MNFLSTSNSDVDVLPGGLGRLRGVGNGWSTIELLGKMSDATAVEELLDLS